MRIAAAMERRLRQRGLLPSARPPSGTVASFSDVPEARLIDTAIRQDPAPIRPAQTLHAERNEYLDRVFDDRPPPRPSPVAIVPGARLATGGGAVITAANQLVHQTLWDEHHYRRDFERPPRVRHAKRISGTHASLISLWCGNYFHWLFDALPRLATLRDAGMGDLPLIVPEPLRGFQQTTLEWLGVPASQLTPFEREHVEPDVLVWASPPAHIIFPSPFVVDWLHRSFPAEPAGGGRRLLLSRRDSRRITNEAQVGAALAPLGFEIVQPETLSFREQVAMFAAAELVVGVHGAAMANTVFARNCSVLELFQPGFLNAYTYTLSCAAGHSYWYLEAEAAEASGPTKGHDVEVPVGPLVETVERMLAERA